ncbi:MAG: chromosomal replication initiator protein DnaA [Ruminococcaceae bacterium]|nr:chromosomal replication initiator protein DnaA [Oscillospiraceae bacterium]MBQ9912817.1 chromosomal replication initiator protein DnaA [Clostridia bacterium]
MNSFDEIWELVKEQLKLSVTEVAYNVWLSPLSFVKFQNDTVYLSITEFKKRIIVDKFSEIINSAFEAVLGFPVTIEYIVPNEHAKNPDIESSDKSDINEYDYTFSNFITGPSNRFAHAAAINVAANPGKAYNPLFIYGHSGLGKTHLLLAIMNEIKAKNPTANIIYTSGEHFTNELIYYIGNHNTYDFHEKYRNCDVLLVDDIHFIARGETIQEEFFHTFNALNNAGSQIVLTSDRPPKEMMTLEERLRTRFEMGLIADVQPPTLETRMAIVKNKAEALGLDLGDDVIQFIGENIKRNIRQLEGAVKKIKAFQDVEGVRPSIAIAKRAISDLINDDQPTPVTVDNIINEVARTFDVSPADIRSDKRNANISQARQVAIYVVEQVTSLSLKAIGIEFGNKHHSSIIYALKEIKNKIEKDISLKATIDDIIKNINES